MKISTEGLVQLNQINTASKVSVAVLDKGLETMETLGQGMVDMIDAAAMERSVNPHIGGNFDMLV